MVKCTLQYYGQEFDLSNDDLLLESIPELSKFVLTVEKV